MLGQVMLQADRSGSMSSLKHHAASGDLHPAMCWPISFIRSLLSAANRQYATLIIRSRTFNALPTCKSPESSISVVNWIETGGCCSAGDHQAKAVPVTMNEMLLRGCTLKNTGYILGLAVYTGNETRIQKNSAKTPNKIGMCLDTPRLSCFHHRQPTTQTACHLA